MTELRKVEKIKGYFNAINEIEWNTKNQVEIEWYIYIYIERERERDEGNLLKREGRETENGLIEKENRK